MRQNDIRALHDQSEGELNKKLVELSQKLNQAKLEKMAGKLSNISSVRVLSDDVARIKTVLSLKQQLVAATPVVETSQKTKKVVRATTSKKTTKKVKE